MTERNYPILDRENDETAYRALSVEMATNSEDRKERINALADAALTIVERSEQIGQPRRPIPVQGAESHAERVLVSVQ